MKIIPELRFPEFVKEEGWILEKVDNLIYKYSEKSDYSNQYPVLTSSREGIMFQRDYYNDRDVASKDNKGYNVVPRGYFTYRHMSDDLIFKFNINNICDRGIVSTLYPVFKVRENKILPYFFQQKLNEGPEFKRFAYAQKQGGSRTYMYLNKLKDLGIYIPKLQEQQKIASCLSSLDELIAGHIDKLEALKDHKKALIQDLFPSAGETVPKIRFPGFEDDGEWMEKKLLEIAENFDSKRIPITSNQREKGNIPYYGASGIIDYVKGYIFDEELLLISEDGANLIARVYPIAFSITGKTWVNNHAHVLKFENWYTQVLVEKYLNFKNIEDFLTGMAQPKLNRGKLDIIPIPLPKNRKEEQKIATCLWAVDELITAQTEKIEQLQEHKKGLMLGLFPKIEG
ncbi:MAG: restriction endonuclease subunit S [Fulvivirga sp.]